MSDATPQPATIGPFLVLRKLGEGAMGVVYAGYDVALDRKVALKLVRPSLLGNEAARERMAREAQAMARLSHPHVVQVYQVGAHENSLYMAMEHIEGQTLGSWLRAQPRPWPAILRTVCDAGRGLAAAHAAGLVHRDFKPDNILVDAEGRARVVDFGLVQADIDDRAPDDEDTEDPVMQSTLPSGQVQKDRSGGTRWSARLTHRGKALGTPLYMSPEQHFGHTVGAYSDQYSFALTLYEALYGEHPFCADSWDGIRQQIRAATIPPPPPGTAVPWRLFKVLARALAYRPEDRWPSLAAMIDALERDPWRRPLGVAALVGLLGLASAASYAVASRNVQDMPRCQATTEELAGVWDRARARTIARAFLATGDRYAEDALARVKSRLDDYAKAWADESRAVCEAHVSGLQSGRMIDLRSACLGRRKGHLAALVDVLMAADREVVAHAVQAVAALPSIGACDDAEGLIRATAPPADPQTATRVERLRERLARAAVLEATGRFEPGLALVREVRAEADAIGHAPLIAEAALIEGRLQVGAANPAAAEAALVRAIHLGISHDMHAVAAEAAARRIFVLGEGLGRYGEAIAAEVFAAALIERARDDGRLAALLSNNLGAVHDLRGDTETARAHYERTIAGLKRQPGPPDPLLAITHNNLGGMYFDRGDFQRARGHFELAMQLFTAILGDAHPFVAHALASLADSDARSGELARAQVSYERALARMEAAYGTRHLYLLQPLTGLGRVHAGSGRLAEAEQAFSRAVAIAEELELTHPLLAQALEGLAELAVAADATDRARELYEQAAAVYSAAGAAEASAKAVLRARQLSGGAN